MKKLVLKPTSGENDVRLIAMIHNWELQADIPAGDKPRQIHYAMPDGLTSVVYVEDTLLQTYYLILNGPAENDAERKVHAGLEVYAQSDLRRLFDPDADTYDALRLVGAATVMAPEEFDQRTFDLLCAALRNPDFEVRRGAVFAITYLPWRPFRALLLDIQAKDPDVSKEAEMVLGIIDEHGWR